MKNCVIPWNQMKANVRQNWAWLMMFPNCFYYANMNKNLLVLFFYWPYSLVVFGRVLKNIVYFVSDGHKKRLRFSVLTVTEKYVLVSKWIYTLFLKNVLHRGRVYLQKKKKVLFSSTMLKYFLAPPIQCTSKYLRWCALWQWLMAFNGILCPFYQFGKITKLC